MKGLEIQYMPEENFKETQQYKDEMKDLRNRKSKYQIMLQNK